MGKRKNLPEDQKEVIVKEYIAFLKKYDISSTTLEHWRKDYEKKYYNYIQYIIPEEERLIKKVPKYLHEFIMENLDKTVPEIKTLIYEKFPNNGYLDANLYAIIYNRKNKEAYDKRSKERYASDKEYFKARSKIYYKNRIKVVGMKIRKNSKKETTNENS